MKNTKVQKYLDKAKKIYYKFKHPMPSETFSMAEELENKIEEGNIIEIAKMLQKEKHLKEVHKLK